MQETGGGGIPFEKSKGQPNLKNPKLIESVVEKSGIKLTDVMLEIGPSNGNLTNKLLKCAKLVVVVEHGHRMVMELNRRFQSTPYTSHLKVFSLLFFFLHGNLKFGENL
jgi:18S rRNA (adenine1779-N6/adenine1780-N6)-dimethyltransferase